MKEYGRYVAAQENFCTRDSCAGWLSTAPCDWRRSDRFPRHLQEWLDTRDAIRDDIFANFWDEELQSFVQSKGSKDLDASVPADAVDALHQPGGPDVAFHHAGD